MDVTHSAPEPDQLTLQIGDQLRVCARPACCTPLVRQPGERVPVFEQRRFCSRACSANPTTPRLDSFLNEGWVRPEWHDRAPCRNDPAPFFPEVRDQAAIERARRMCAGCPFRGPCVLEGIHLNDTDGIRGGRAMGKMSSRERYTLVTGEAS